MCELLSFLLSLPISYFIHIFLSILLVTTTKRKAVENYSTADAFLFCGLQKTDFSKKIIAITLCWDTKLSYGNFACSSYFWSLCY